MNTLKKVLFSQEYELKERLFVLSGFIGSIAMIIVFVLTIVSGQGLLVAFGIGMGAVVVIAMTMYTLQTKRYKLGGSVIVLFANCIALPFGYLMGGGAYSGSPTWFIIAILFVFMIFDGRLFWIYLMLSAAAFGAVTIIGAKFPESVIPLSTEFGIYEDTFVAALTVGLLAGILLKFQSNILEKELALTREQTEEIEKLNDSQNRFFSSMSHEIRTPINTIIGLNEMTMREKDLPEEVMENSLNIQSASKILLSLINDILDLSKIQSGRMEVVAAQYETSRMLSEIVNLLWSRAREKGLRFDINVGDSIPSMLYGDEVRIKQIIINLLTNAIKYTQEGSVTLRVDGEKKDANRFLLRVEVADTGIGIRKENIPYLFESFKRVEGSDTRNIEGTGLGLSISKQLVELMDGRISVDSIYTKGSTFRVEIPQKIVNDEPLSFKKISQTTAPKEVYQQSFEAPEAHVLIVDDNDMNRLVCRKLLRGTKVQVDLADSGRECLAKTREMHYDAIFMDHEMPGMDGIETLQKVRSQNNGQCKTSPVIALTANAGSNMSSFYLENGFQAYLAKPIHGSLLEATLLQFLPQELIEKSLSVQTEETLRVAKTFKKRSILVTADCICDLPDDIVHENGIRLMPFYIITEDGRFRDTEEIDADNMFQYMESGKKLPKAVPSEVEEYERFFGEALTEAEAVLHICASSKTSDSYKNALKAADSFGNVYVYDSENISCGLGMLVVRAAEMAAAGRQMDEIIRELDVYRNRISTSFIIPTLKEVVRNKRAPFIGIVLSNVFNFELVFRMVRGELRLRSFHIGYVTGAAEQFIRNTFKRNHDVDTKVLYITYAGCNAEEREKIVSEIRKYVDFNQIILQKASATIASNSGRHSFGLFYKKRKENGD